MRVSDGDVVDLNSKENSLHLLFNNGGVMTPPAGSKTAQGFELQLGTNLFGHHLLTKLLLPTMISTSERSNASFSSPSSSSVRIIHTSSMAHTGAPKSGIEWKDPNNGLSGMPLYGQSKWGNIVLSNELARRYGRDGIVSHSVSPGLAASDLQRHMPGIVRKIMVS